MPRFETQVQLIKHKVLKEVSKLAYKDKLDNNLLDIPETIIPGPDPITRCCIYKERAIIKDRVKLALGGNKKKDNIIEVIDTACDECPIDRFVVTEACRGCLAHKCSKACPVDAIYYVGNKAFIDNNKCIECGKCKKACPFNAISDVMRPCRTACPVNAISIDKDKKAIIDDSKCIQCGACINQCPFGALMDKSFIVDVIKELKDKNQKIYAMIAPAIASQFDNIELKKVISGIKKLGFDDVFEVALGADIVTKHETKEFSDFIKNKNFMTSSCCPAFVSYIEKEYPELVDNISNTVSPMIATSELIKKEYKNSKVVFIGPCTAKKMEIKRYDNTDYVLTFEELYAMFDALDINLEELEDSSINNASYFGRVFARTGGLTESITHIIKKQDIDINFDPIKCDGISDCKKALSMGKLNKLKGNFIEGMACDGGCISGAASLNHTPKSKKKIDSYGKSALKKDITKNINKYNLKNLNLERR
ncbi:MAG: 4Fe-4S dicluster domain-containing protein [Firmicutes bacterium]|nr:4Fe-4S dicluster domain-containing protein [Bacillota bacterium]